jgi:hypothetical protein
LQQKANELYLMFCDHRNVSKKLNAWWWSTPRKVYF